MKILFFDLETTGLDNKASAIHQLSGCVEIDGNVYEEFDFKMAPFDGAIIEAKALEAAGVTKDQIAAYPNQHDQYLAFIKLLGKYVDKYKKTDKFFLAGYNNASFDNPFLRQWFISNFDDYFGSWFWPNSLDVMILATPALAAVRGQMPNFQLKTVAAQMGIAVDETKLHDAQYDIYLTRKIYQNISA